MVQEHKVLLGGEHPDTEETSSGYFVAPTIFGDCTNHMESMRDEVFGPVLRLARFKTDEEAITLVNDTRHGLSASLWTRDVRKGLVPAGRVKAGTVWINDRLIIFCDTPGRGKESGWGKDLSKMVLYEYTMTKHIMRISPENV